MNSIFGRLLCKELGRANYKRYSDTCRVTVPEQAELRKVLYQDIYLQLSGHDSDTLKAMRNRLAEAMLKAFYVNKGYFPIVVCSMIAIAILYAMTYPNIVFWGAIAMVGLLFTLKTVEYVKNHYCHIDAQLLLLYKSALEERLQKTVEPVPPCCD